MLKHTEEFLHLKFSQREGLISIPVPIELGELSDDLRMGIAGYYFEISEKNRSGE